jgi:hypothetical protein
MIGKVIRGTNVRGLLYYLYSPGRANEHIDPHLVAGFGDPGELEPDRRADGSPDVRRLAMLLTQPLAALAAPGYDKPVWHCAVRAAPEDRVLSDAEWAQVAAQVMERTGLAMTADEGGARWVAVRHAADHVHLVATLARQDGGRPRIWNDFYRVREACQAAEQQLGLARTAPADRTAARRATRAETEQAARRGWAEAPRVRLRREVCTAAAGAGSQDEFFTRLDQAGVLVRRRYSTMRAGEVTGYAVGLAAHTGRDGGVIWYGGGKLAADLSLPKLRARWARPADGAGPGAGVGPAAARAVLRGAVTGAAEQARDEPGFFAALREAGVAVRLRFSETDPGQVTGYSVTLPGHVGPDEAVRWYGGGRLAADLTLPRLRRGWKRGRGGVPEHSGAFRFTAAERNAIYDHAAGQAAAAAERIRWSARGDPAGGAEGIRQFLDIGTGLPTVDNTHEVAQRVTPECRIVYVDNDPLVLVHARALLTSTPPGVTDYIDADIRNPEEILTAAARTLDFTRPVAIMLMGIMGHVTDDAEVHSILHQLLDRVPASSFLVLRDATNTDKTFTDAQKLYDQTGAIPYKLRSPEQIGHFFDGLELVEPGVVSPLEWRPEATPFGSPRHVDMACGVARKR